MSLAPGTSILPHKELFWILFLLEEFDLRFFLVESLVLGELCFETLGFRFRPCNFGEFFLGSLMWVFFGY